MYVPMTMTADYYAIESCEIYRQKKRIIKTATEQCDLIKDELMDKYFTRCDTLIDQSGLIIATARLQEAEEFDRKRFQEEHPDLYAQYVVKKTRQPLLVK
jgi:hypothetical protein